MSKEVAPRKSHWQKIIKLSSNVYDRLYKSAHDRNVSHREKQEMYINDHVHGVMVENRE